MPWSVLLLSWSHRCWREKSLSRQQVKMFSTQHRFSQQNGFSVPAFHLHVDGKNECQPWIPNSTIFFFKLQNNWQVKRNKVSDLQPLSSWCCITHRNRKIMDSSWVNYLDKIFHNKDIILNIQMYQWRIGLFKVRLSRPK